jgi:spermidine/putrescine transport system substrate-binding protein
MSNACEDQMSGDRSNFAPSLATEPSSAGVARRTFITRAALTAAGLSVPGLLGACSQTSPSGVSGAAAFRGPGGLPLARPDRPMRLPIYTDNKPIASGLAPEKGPLQVYIFTAYINPAVVSSFEKKHGVTVTVTTYSSTEEALAKIASRGVQFDVFFPEAQSLEALVVGRLLQPLNLSYIPNFTGNVWSSLHSPWYDIGSRYTVPYTVWTTGIGWRADKLPGFTPAQFANPWNALWRAGPRISGRVGLLDDMREGLSHALLRNGVTNVNSENAEQLTSAKNALIDLINSTNLKIDTNEYQRLADGSLWLHQAWSGDMAAAPLYVPKGTHGSVLRYWWPGTGKGPINNDTITVLNGSKNPVLSHLFINHLLDTQEAVRNFSNILYQQPLNDITPELLISKGLILPTLQNTLIGKDQLGHGYVQGPLSLHGELLWENSWTAVKSA